MMNIEYSKPVELTKNSGLIFNHKISSKCLIHSFSSRKQIKYIKYCIAT